MTEEIVDLDLYGILGITVSATTNEIRRAYKKEALKCHPDKNPDNPRASELFKRLTKVLEVLLNTSARDVYDQRLKAKEAARLRHSALDGQRKRFKERLEEREKTSSKTLSGEELLKHEVERLRKDGAKLLAEEISKLQEEVLNVSENEEQITSNCQIKASWASKTEECNLYTQETLLKIFSKYGTVAAVAVAGNKAIIEFNEPKAADLATKIEIGFLENPLKVKLIGTSEKRKPRKQSAQSKYDSESISARTIRQAAERKRLVEEMMRDD